MTTLKLALDWTPNINHIGFFIAQEKGFYKDLDLDIEMLDPSSDDYKTTPAKKVELGKAHFALCPTESVISYRTKRNPFDLIGVAAILKKDLSAIAVKKDSQILSPKDLDYKKYSSYQARYEDQIVRQMIKNDGGIGAIDIGYPKKLGIWETVINGSYDATWIFLNWEGVAAKTLDADFRYFKMRDYDIPYSYSPVLVAGQEAMEANKADYRAFITGTKKGFKYCQTNPEEAVKIFKSFVPTSDQHIDLAAALSQTLDSFSTNEHWGKFDKEEVTRFLDWIYEHQLETKVLQPNELFTNSLLD